MTNPSYYILISLLNMVKKGAAPDCANGTRASFYLHGILYKGRTAAGFQNLLENMHLDNHT